MKRSTLMFLGLLGIGLAALPVAASVNETDSNFDGKPDQWEYLDAKGNTVKIEHDGNFDGKVDQIEYYKPGKVLARVEFDSDNNGKMD
ncbi:MAG: hypothetical protein ACE5ER_06775, partial [Nitrospinaceae bacterium]